MGAEIEIVRYHPELKSQVLELQTHLWSSDLTLNGAYFDWKYERNPYINRPLLYIALSRGKAVGMRGMFGSKWQIGSCTNTLNGLYVDDLVIAPAYRNKGLIARIMKVALADPATQGYDFVFNLSA